jgi:hypothetical protein
MNGYFMATQIEFEIPPVDISRPEQCAAIIRERMRRWQGQRPSAFHRYPVPEAFPVGLLS